MSGSIKQNLRLGVFVTLGTIVLLVALFLVGQKQNLFNKHIVLNAQFSDVSGLQLGNNIYYSGIKAGTVKDIKIINPNAILVQMHIDSKIAPHINKKAKATINLSGLVGNMMINIIPSSSESVAVISGDTIATYTQSNTKNMLSTLNTTNEKAALITDNLLQITNHIMEGKGTLGALLHDTQMKNDVKKALYEFKEASVMANSTLTKLNNILSTENHKTSVAGVLLSDPDAGLKIKNLINDLEASGEQIHTISSNIEKLSTNLNSKKGAIHFLSQDTQFAEDIDTSMKNIKEGTIKFNQNMEALQSNFLFKKYYKKLKTDQSLNK